MNLTYKNKQPGHIKDLTITDIPQIAALHAKIFYKHKYYGKKLEDYYRVVFLESSNFAKEFPSLVYVDANGQIIGFIGRIVRRMKWGEKDIHAAIAHRLMVDPEGKDPLAALKLVRGFLAGPQDLSFSDGASDEGWQFWKGLGGKVCEIYSMNWFYPLQPCQYLLNLAQKKFTLGKIVKPLATLADGIVRHKKYYAFPKPADKTKLLPLEDETLLSFIRETAKDYVLVPEYSMDYFIWLMNFLRSNKHRGKLRGWKVVNNKEHIIGAFLYYIMKDRTVEVMWLGARPKAHEEVFRHLLWQTKQEGAIGIQGRMEPKFAKAFFSHQCLFKRGSWALFHAKDPELLNIISRCEALITTLEGELWLRSPKDML